MNEEEGQKPPQQQYNVGDVVGGWRLGPDGQWHSTLPDPGIQEKDSYPRYVPRPAPEPKGMSTGAKIAIGLGAAFGGILLIGVLGVAFGAGGEPDAAPAPAATVTETEAAPTPEETEDITDSGDYQGTLALLEAALDKSNSNEKIVCLQWGMDRDKWESKFTNIAVRTGFEYAPANAAVNDFFDGMCGV